MGGFSKLMGQIVNPAIGIEPLVFNDPNQILSQMVFGISKHVSFQGSGPCPQRDDDPRLEEYCARLNNRLAWFAEENGCEFFLFVTDLDREFGIHRRDQIVAKLRRWVPEICLLQLNPAADSRYDEDDLDNLISVGF
ncbi:MAG: hypothetical protein NT069_18035 [Planctomycetota bacterium]|nr:hypothetical protein [Planctomycetota bacterium]